VKSIKQAFGILIVALALFGAYSLVCPKKPVDDSVTDDFMAELAEEGLFLNDGEGTGGKSALFNTLGNLPSLPSSGQTASGKPAALPSLFGEGSAPAPKYGQPNEDGLDLQIPSDHDEAPVWNENSSQTPQNVPGIPELPLPEIPTFDDAPLFDVPATIPAEATETTLIPKISEDSLHFPETIPAFPLPTDETLDSSAAFTPVDSTTTVFPNRTEVPLEGFRQTDLTPSYNQRAPTSEGGVRPLPTVTEGAMMTLASGATTNYSAPSGDFSFSNPPQDFPATDVADFSNISNFDSMPNDFAPAPVVEANTANQSPGLARSSQRKTTSDTAPLQIAQPMDPPAMPTGMNPLESPVSPARNPISQNTIRPEVTQRITQIKSVLNDETAEYRRGHQMITELYMSDLSFAERELVLPIADKCGWAAFFSSRSFDPYEWRRTIRPTDTLQNLAAENGISPELILKINRLQHPGQLTPGKEDVKIPKGPFDATVFLDRKEMVITARGLYACRFRIGIGSPEIINEGVYQIESKFPEPRYIGETGEISFGDPRNPLGTHWIGLDQEIGIHGTNTPSCLGTDNAPVEGFSLDNRDVAEVYDMLTQESRVTVRK